ncbi:FAD-dependent monooxygenase [Kocuria rosea]|uniref:FAD-dependent monooxygenase n=1 Tax=Kocuria rosea TaxID=1275 RepID=UPI0030167082
MMSVEKVLIVGAGVGGLATAAALGQRGVAVEVVEVRADNHVLGVGINQPANSLRALDAIGVLEQCLAAGYQYDRNAFFDWQGTPVVEVPTSMGDDRIPANNALSRKDLQTILLTAATEAGATITNGVTVDTVENGPDAVSVGFTDGRTATYDLVIGADGYRSPLRRKLFGNLGEPQFTGYAVWRLMRPRPQEVTHTMLFQGDGTKAGLIPLSEDTMYLLHVTPEPGNPKHDPAQFDTLLKDRLAGYGGIIGQVRESITGPEGIVYSPLSEVSLPAPWFSGRTVIIGDAAHASAPHLTQGAAMALEDAVILAEELQNKSSVSDALQCFMERRFERAKLVQDVSHAILFGEMAVTEEALPHAVEHMREALPGQMATVETILNQAA